MSTKKAIDVIGVPLDLGVKELGLKLGPDALREAKLIEIFQDLGIDVRDRGNIEISTRRSGNNACHIESITKCCNNVAVLVRESLTSGRIPICLGGDHSLAIGSVAAIMSVLAKVGILWLDAHPDANTPETSPSGNIHGMPIAIMLGCGPEALVAVRPKGRHLGVEDLVLLGVHDIDEGEATFIREHNVQMLTIFDVLEQGLPVIVNQIIGQLSEKTRNLHISLDLDVLSETVAPGVGLPSRGGFDMREMLYICRRFASECNVTSIDVVGLNPVRDKNMVTAHCAIEIIMELLGCPLSYNYYTYLKAQT